MPKFLSKELKIGNKLEKMGVFDPLLDMDSNYFINIKRLKETNVNEFKSSYEKINDYFKKIGILLSVSKVNSDRAFREALKLFNFPEVNGICLGFANGTHGAGFGKKLRLQIINDAKEIIRLGENEPEIFHLIGLFEENVGPDRLSDMIARIIFDDISKFTIRINKEVGINRANCPKQIFDKNGIMKNPYKKDKVLLLPKDILHELLIARDWDDIDRVCSENDKIRNEINHVVGKEWSKLSTSIKKGIIKEYIFKKPAILKKVLVDYREATTPAYDFDKDKSGEYIVARIASNLPYEYPLEVDKKPKTSSEVAIIICNKFKYLVENNKVSELLYVDDKPRSERIVQRAFFCVAESYCEANNLDVSPEANAGRGPVDFKMSRGKDKTIVEIKLTSNQNIVHGFETQIKEYAKAEKTEDMIYLVIDNGGPKDRLKNIKKAYTEVASDAKRPELIIIDAIPKQSASKYKPSN